ncbi:MAG: adenosylcobinamide amidohydrolase, partial [Bryobacterales bacterium]|nr:adenosylcobinamide amidohydrolase [Bryobacterales bacterium]
MSLFTLRCFDRWMTLRFPHPMQCWSWAIVNGGAAVSDTLAWLFLQPDEISHSIDVAAWYREQLRDVGLEHAVGLMTSRRRH